MSDSFNCPSGSATVRKIATGDFVVCFPGNFPEVALTSPINTNAAGADNIVSWGRIADGGCVGGSAVEVKVFDNDGTAQSERFSVELLH